MERQEISLIVERQRKYFLSGKTLPVKFRIEMLKKLYSSVKSKEKKIAEALNKDLGKSEYEGFMCEIGLVLSEISYMIKNTRRFSKPERVKTPLAQFASKSYVAKDPYGTVLIMSPWNYPFLLTIDPLVNAIATGNTAVIKPSAYSPTTSDIVEEIISECFSPEYVEVVTGGRAENQGLLEEKFDLVFFTGSQGVGKEVLRHTAEHLTPAVLELGGKSPCIVDSTAKIKLAARRIVFGKFLNCGQTCVAPDYLICEKSIKDNLVSEIIREIKRQYGENPLENPDYGKIINKKHFDRLVSLIDKDKTSFGGNSDEKTEQIAPTVIDNATWNDEIMQEEIFGPLLPVLTFESYDELISLLNDKPKPLALYIFSEDKSAIKKITSRVRYGGGCVNDVVIHLATSEMGFGGVGESGMGAYHGRVGFDTFTHKKSIVDKKTWLDLPMRYQPYNKGLYSKMLHLFLK
ncbi:MAG: aldehyde dehydrogenase [Clostridia bacterium]|nr:aldehyde dehydrogenase [Clostridia bacterium]